jgi:hypothetical protein
MKSAGGGELRGGIQNPGGDHGQDQIAIAVGMLIEETPEM